MEKWFDEIRLWLFENRWKKIFGFLLLCFAVNTVVWGILEPSGINTKIECYAVYHYSFVVIVSSILLFFLVPNQLIREFNINLNPNGFSGSGWTTKEGSPSLTQILDNILGKSLQFAGGFNDASYFPFVGVNRKAKAIRLYFLPEQNFLIYLRVLVMVKNESTTKEIWLALKDGIEEVEKISEAEWSIPTKPTIKYNSWFELTITLPRINIKGSELSDFKYKELLGIQVRGTGKLYNVSLYK